MCSEYKIIKSQITRNINKRLSSDVIKFDEIPDESKYHKTVRNVIFMIFKNSNLIILQSSFQAQLFTKYNENIRKDYFKIYRCTEYKTLSKWKSFII